MRTVISLSLPKPLARELAHLAKRLRVPRSLVVRQAVEKHLSDEKFERLLVRMRDHAAKRGIVSEEDVFKIVS
ncbi:MAG: ribbon-helix-helix protein, CopG family [Nitrospirae bacterium]|nr:ribbon-helix-helix protein, CopG family [Nitrospirota bacterium]